MTLSRRGGPGVARAPAGAAAREPGGGAASRRLDLTPFRVRHVRRGIAQLVVTTLLFVAGWWAMWASLEVGYWLTLLLAIPTAGMVVRLFVLQHDCGHGTMFHSQTANHAVGIAISVITMTPYHCWRRQHANHHATNGQLDHRGSGDVTTLTVDEYRRLSVWQRAAYRLYRHPLILFGVGPIVYFALIQRLPCSVPATWKRERRSIHETNLLIIAACLAAAWAFGPSVFLRIHLPVLALAASIGTWLFFVQHQFAPTYWERDDEWDHTRAAVEGSSFLDLPEPLRWLTANIGYHHVHHLDSRIPNYALADCHAAHPALQAARRLTLVDAILCARLKLWDEAAQELITFRDAKRRL